MPGHHCLPLGLTLPLLAGCAGLWGPAADSPEASAATLNMQLGISYMQQGNFDVALEKLNKAISYNDRLAEAHNALGVLYDETRQPVLAEQHFQRALALDPGFTLAQLNYAQFLCTHNKPADGESRFLALAANPPNGAVDIAIRAYSGAAVCALATADRPRAESYLRKALELKDDSTVLYRLADLYYAQGDYLKARAFLQRFHSQAGYNPESLWLGISIEEKLGDTALQRQYTDLLLSRFAESAAARRLQNR